MTIHSFPPISRPDATRLILGSIPSKRSLLEGQYYGHPRNSFWRIAGALLGFDPTAPYKERGEALREARVALWDVLRSCTRESSLDSDIVESTIVTNDFESFLAEHREITVIYFNGGKAFESFRKHVAPGLPELGERGIDLVRLPSTSPANARPGFERKLEAWRCIRN